VRLIDKSRRGWNKMLNQVHEGVTRPWERWWGERVSSKFLRNPAQINHPVRGIIVKESCKVGDSVLDVGCATCIDYPLFKGKIRYTGIDVTENFVKCARELYPEVNVIHGDAFDLLFEDASYHTGYCKDLIEHLPPEGYKKVIKEMWRVTIKLMMISFSMPPKDNPTVYNLTKFGYYQNNYNKEEIIGFLEGLEGLDSLKIIENIGHNNSALYVCMHAREVFQRG